VCLPQASCSRVVIRCSVDILNLLKLLIIALDAPVQFGDVPASTKKSSCILVSRSLPPAGTRFQPHPQPTLRRRHHRGAASCAIHAADHRTHARLINGSSGGCDLRLCPVWECAPIDGPPWPGALSAFEWHPRAAGRHYQGRQCPGTMRLDRGSLDLPHTGMGQP
jgi:hypothetical protein